MGDMDLRTNHQDAAQILERSGLTEPPCFAARRLRMTNNPSREVHVFENLHPRLWTAAILCVAKLTAANNGGLSRASALQDQTAPASGLDAEASCGI